ncbi:MAG: FkbM family methyltransferase [Verrucomicrobia bacterium]|nr:FkbM family methyltransferase [Verrucomicrobiota bacterium]
MSAPVYPAATCLLDFAGSLRMLVPEDPRQITTFILTEQGDWFEAEIRFIRRWLQPGMRVVDIGANFGVYTLTAASRVGREGRVWAFEPGAFPRSCLAQSLALNGFENVELRSEAVSERTGRASLDATGGAELARLGSEGAAGEPVVVTTLDAAFAACRSEPFDLLKLDAEGEEPRILRGARRFLAERDPLILCEWPLEPSRRSELLSELRELGLRLFRLLPGPDLLVPLETERPLDSFQLNFFAAGTRRIAHLLASGDLAESPAPLAESTAEEDRAVVHAWLAARPWARSVWPEAHPAGSPRIHRALADVVRGEDPARPRPERWAWLARAQRFLTKPRAPTLELCFTAARVALALGAQEAACGQLGLAQALLPGQTGHALGPFLPPLAEQNELEPVGPPAQWLQAMLDEAIVARAGHSICFGLRQRLPVLERLSANPHASSSAQRRLAAVRRAQASKDTPLW